ncbi:MAG: carbamoyltransferase [Helicobacteraceae bacterium]|jgi:carbamoyltransferase|nr:carbamoyltransferase [Helicobacteraceae bacterium]
MKILGISAFYHDSAAALIIDGEIAAAAQEERFTRIKHDPSFPNNAIEWILSSRKISLSEIDFAVFYDKPFLKFERLLETYVAFAPKGFVSFQKAMPIWLAEKLFQKDLLRRQLARFAPDFDWRNKLLFCEHHLSHAASAFFPSPFEKAVALTMDGVGEWATTSIAFGDKNTLRIDRELHFPHSLGLLYSALTYYAGFKVNSGEYKIMGLAPYGEPKYAQVIFDNLIDLKDDGSFRLNQSYFDYCTGLKMTNKKFDVLFGGAARKADDPLTQREMDLAASIQAVTEEIILRIVRSIAKETGEENLCLAGGVALNCVANGKLLKKGYFKRMWIQPAAGDAGGAIGAALTAYYVHLGNPRVINDGDSMKGSYLGPSFSADEAAKRLTKVGAAFETLDEETLLDRVVSALCEGKAIGWFQGRMEFGPRALGARSIIADPRSITMQKTLNLKIKFRESFRPFAPSVLSEKAGDYFELDEKSPYMLLTADVRENLRRAMSEEEQALFGIDKLNRPRSSISAVTHVDYSARVQTVHKMTNPRYHALISRFEAKTGCAVLVNTSFNVRGEPIVCSPEDAFRCFMGTGLDVLVVENCYMEKPFQNPALKLDYKSAFEPD